MSIISCATCPKSRATHAFMHFEEAAARAKKNAVGRAVGWSMIVPIINIPIAATASAMHTKKVNKQIVQDFSAKGFPDGTILPKKDLSGFIFVEIDKKRTALSGLNLFVTSKRADTNESVTVATPLPPIALK